MKLEREGGLSVQEKDHLTEWLDQSVFHRQSFECLVNIWSGANIFTELAVRQGVEIKNPTLVAIVFPSIENLFIEQVMST